MAEAHFHRYRYYLLFCVAILIIVNCFFINNKEKRTEDKKNDYVRVDSLSVIRETPHYIKEDNYSVISTTPTSLIVDNCKDEWTNENIVGRCFGLDDVNNSVKMTAQECRGTCCSRKDCISWQFIEASSICKNGGKVRIGGEGFHSLTASPTN